MTDFRAELYARYRTLQGLGGASSAGQRASQAAWWSRKLKPALGRLGRDAVILEIGCGAGDLLAFLKAQGHERASGIDVSPEQVKQAKAQGLAVEEGDALAHLRAHAGQFDAIFAFDFVEHFHKDELLSLATLMHDALKPGGLLVIQTPNGEGLFPGQVVYGDLTHLTIFTPSSMRQLLLGCGFDGFVFGETGPIAKGLRGVLRTFAWRAIRRVANLVRRIETGKRQEVWTENFLCFAERSR